MTAALAIHMPADGPETNAPVEKQLEQKSSQVVRNAQAVAVENEASLRTAADMTLGLVELRNEIVAHHAPMKKATYAAWKAVCAAENLLLEPVAQAEEIVKAKIGTFQLEQRRIQQERERLDLEAQQQRMAEQTEAAIEAAEAVGATSEEVQAIIAQPVVYSLPTAMGPVRIPGITTRKTLKVQVTDLKALCRAIGEGKAATNLVTPNESALNALARAQGADMPKYTPGVRVFEVANVAAGRRK